MHVLTVWLSLKHSQSCFRDYSSIFDSINITCDELSLDMQAVVLKPQQKSVNLCEIILLQMQHV
jgi:hypothetical protein